MAYSEFVGPALHVIIHGSADNLADTEVEYHPAALQVVSSTSDMLCEMDIVDSLMGFHGALAYINDVTASLTVEGFIVNPYEVLWDNLPTDYSDSILALHQRINELELPDRTFTYDSLPDPGSLIHSFLNNL